MRCNKIPSVQRKPQNLITKIITMTWTKENNSLLLIMNLGKYFELDTRNKDAK